MRKLAVGIISMILWTTSPANGTVSHPRTIVSPAPTVIKNASRHVKLLRVPRPKIFRSNPYRASYFLAHWEDNDDIEIDDDDKITGPRRDQYGRVKTNPTPDDPEGDVTPDIEWKLFLIRQAVMIKHGIRHT